MKKHPLLKDLLEDVLETTVVGLQDGVLGTQVQGPLLADGILEAAVSKARDGLCTARDPRESRFSCEREGRELRFMVCPSHQHATRVTLLTWNTCIWTSRTYGISFQQENISRAEKQLRLCTHYQIITMEQPVVHRNSASCATEQSPNQLSTRIFFRYIK